VGTGGYTDFECKKEVLQALDELCQKLIEQGAISSNNPRLGEIILHVQKSPNWKKIPCLKKDKPKVENWDFL